MPKFQVEVTATANGYLTVEAADAAAARNSIKSLEPSVEFGGRGFELDQSLFDRLADLRIDGIQPVEEEPERGLWGQSTGANR